MARKYAVSEEQLGLSVEEMLALPPLPRTFRFEMRRDERAVRVKGGEEVDEERERVETELEETELEETRREMEDVKRRLRGLALGVR